MGCFGYICRKCGTAIRGDCHKGGENCVLIHVRHGVEIGRAVGHYGEYGDVIEDKLFRSSEKENEEGNPNSHTEICTSEMRLKDSFNFYGFRIYNGVPTTLNGVFYSERCKLEAPLKEERDKIYSDHKEGIITEEQCNERIIEVREKLKEMDEWENRQKINKNLQAIWDSLEIPKDFKYSGIVAWHKKCYDEASDEEKNDLTPSLTDPNQSWGRVRKKYK